MFEFVVTRAGHAAGFALAVVVAMTSGATAQTTAPAPPAAAQPAAGSAPASPPPMPDTNKMTLLIQNTMAALAQANMTGNYTVLHALAAPGFQQTNPPQKLAELFAAQRAAGLDVTPVILFVPTLTSIPAIDPKGMLRLTGYYDTKPQNVTFDLLFVPHAGVWRMFGISVNTRPASPQVADKPAAPAPEPAKAAAPAAKKK